MAAANNAPPADPDRPAIPRNGGAGMHDDGNTAPVLPCHAPRSFESVNGAHPSRRLRYHVGSLGLGP
jgi:hypothetical protein